MLVGFAEGLGAAKTYAARNGYQISPNRELIGLGTANLAAGLSSGMVVNGSLSKTAVNGSAGAKTQASGLVVAVLTVITLLFLTGLFEDLPEATLAAVVIAALIELVDYKALRALYRAYTSRLGQIYGLAARADFIAAIAAMLGVLIFDTLPGLVIGVADSLLLLLLPGVPAACRGPRRRSPAAAASGPMSPSTPKTRPCPGSPSCGSSPACSSPTPTTCAPPSKTPPPPTAPGRSCWTAKPCRSST